MFKGWDKVLQFHVHNTMMNHRTTGYILAIAMNTDTQEGCRDIRIYV